MPSEQCNNMTKQQKINAGIEKLKAKRAEAAEKKARDAANPPAKAGPSTTANSVNQAPKPSNSDSISSLPRIKKRPGKSITEIAKKKAAEEASITAENKRKMAEKEDGEIDSDGEEIVFTGHMNQGDRNQKSAQVKNKDVKTKASVPATGRVSSNNKDQKIFGSSSNSNEAKKTTKFQPDIPKFPSRFQKSQDLEESEETKQSSVKRKMFDTDSSDSEEEIAKPAKKAKTTKVGMNYENPPTKRKKSDEEEISNPVKKQRITEPIKKAVAVPAKRAPIKETKVANKPTKNLLGFGGSKAIKKPAPKKNSIKPKSVSETVKDHGKDTKKNMMNSVSPPRKPKVSVSQNKSAAPLTGESSKLRYLPNVSMEELFGGASSVAAQPIETPRSAFDKAPVKTKSSRRGPTPASNVEVTKSSAPLRSVSTTESTKLPQPSRRKVTPAPDIEAAKLSVSIKRPSRVSAFTSGKAQSSRRDTSPASSDEVTKQSTSSIPLPTPKSIEEVQPTHRRAVPAPHVERKKPSVPSASSSTKTLSKDVAGSKPSNIIKSTSALRKVIIEGNQNDGVAPAPESPVVEKAENVRGNMEEKPEPKEVEVPEQQKHVAEMNHSFPAELNLETEVSPDTDINEDLFSPGPKTEPSNNQAQRGIAQFLGVPRLAVAKPGQETVVNSYFRFEDTKETFKPVTPDPELSDTAETRDPMEIELEREMEIELQNSSHAEQLHSALEALIASRFENGESSDQDSSDDYSDGYSSRDESDEEQCEVPQKTTKQPVLYKGYNGVMQEEPFYAMDRGYESEMSDVDEGEQYPPPPSLADCHVFYRPFIPGSVFNIPVARKTVSNEPAIPSAAFDELEAEMERCLETQMAEDAAAEDESSPQTLPLSAFDGPELEDDSSSDERHQHDHSEEIASAIVESSEFSPKSSSHDFSASPTEFEEEFHAASYKPKNASNHGPESTDEDPFSMLNTSFNFSNNTEMSAEQSSTSEGDNFNSDEESNDRSEKGTPRSESPEVTIGPYISPDGCVGLPPLEDFPDVSEASDDCNDYDDSSDSDVDESEIFILDDAPPTESEEGEDPQDLDEDEDAEFYRKHRVPEGLENVNITMEPTELKMLKAKTSWELFELQQWEQENEAEVYAIFDRELLLRNLNVSKKRIANYMDVLKGYENRTVPKAEALKEDDSSDDSDNDEFSHPTNINVPKQVEIIAVPDSRPVVDFYSFVDINSHPFGPIDW